MSEGLLLNASRTENLIATVRASLQAIRNMLGGGTQTEETESQIKQLELLEQLLLDQEARLESINNVLEEFNYSVAHELCAPLRRISGFTKEIKQRFAANFDLKGLDCLDHILESSQQMNDLIDALMQISRLSHVELQRNIVELSEIASGIAEELKQSAPERVATFTIQTQLQSIGDPDLLKLALRELLANAWKYTMRTEPTVIEFGSFELATERVFYIRDNGVGFDMSDYGRLFHPFQRLHESTAFAGNGIGLTAVKRIIDRHGGRIWAEGVLEHGATFYFTL